MNTTNLIKSIRPLPLKTFSWNKDKNSLSAESSDFGPFRNGLWWLQQIWDDACDIGIAIESHHTGKIERFYLVMEEVQDGDLLAWHFKPCNENCRVQSVVIFND